MITKVKVNTGDSVDGTGRPIRIHLEVDMYQPTDEELAIVQEVAAGCLARFEKK